LEGDIFGEVLGLGGGLDLGGEETFVSTTLSVRGFPSIITGGQYTLGDSSLIISGLQCNIPLESSESNFFFVSLLGDHLSLLEEFPDLLFSPFFFPIDKSL